MTSILLAASVLLAFLPLASAAPPRCYRGFGEMDEDLCPQMDPDDPDPASPDGASCIAHGLLMRETVLGGLAATLKHDRSRSAAWTLPSPWALSPPEAAPAPGLNPPANPQGHADAHQLDVDATAVLGLVHVEADNVWSRCDVASRGTLNASESHAYGRAGIENLRLEVLGIPIVDAIEVLEFEADARGSNPGPAIAFARCDLVKVDTPGTLLAPVPDAWICTPPNTAFAVPASPLADVVIVFNEQWGPVLNAAGQQTYGGAAMRVIVNLLGVGATVEIVVGAVSVAVGASQGGAAMVDVPENACVTLFPLVVPPPYV